MKTLFALIALSLSITACATTVTPRSRIRSAECNNGGCQHGAYLLQSGPIVQTDLRHQ